MAAIDWVALSRLVPELALVVVFGIFTLKLLERQDDKDKVRDVAFLEAISTQATAFLQSTKKQDDEWRDWLKIEREGHGAAEARLSDEMKNLVTAVGVNNALIAQHDIWERTLTGVDRGKAMRGD